MWVGLISYALKQSFSLLVRSYSSLLVTANRYLSSEKRRLQTDGNGSVVVVEGFTHDVL